MDIVIRTNKKKHLPSTSSHSFQPHCANDRWNKSEEDLNSFPLEELEETTKSLRTTLAEIQ